MAKVPAPRFKTFENLVVDRMTRVPPERWEQDPVIKRYLGARAIANAAGGYQPDAEVVAKLRDAAVRELTTTGQPGLAVQAYALVDNPTGFLRTMTGKDRAEKPIRLGAQQLSEDMFGFLGRGGLLGRIRESRNPLVFAEVVREIRDRQHLTDPATWEALRQTILPYAPSATEIIDAGPPFTDASGQQRGTGQLSEQQVEALLDFVLSAEEKQQLLGVQQ
jgi:hypothetical protein